MVFAARAAENERAGWRRANKQEALALGKEIRGQFPGVSSRAEGQRPASHWGGWRSNSANLMPTPLPVLATQRVPAHRLLTFEPLLGLAVTVSLRFEPGGLLIRSF